MEIFPWLESLLDKAPMDLPAPDDEPEAYQMVLGCVPEHLNRLARMAVQAERAYLEVQQAIDARVASPVVLIGQMQTERATEVAMFRNVQASIIPAKDLFGTWLMNELKHHFQLPVGTVITIGKGWQVYAHRLEDEPKPAPKLVI